MILFSISNFRPGFGGMLCDEGKFSNKKFILVKSTILIYYKMIKNRVKLLRIESKNLLKRRKVYIPNERRRFLQMRMPKRIQR